MKTEMKAGTLLMDGKYEEPRPVFPNRDSFVLLCAPAGARTPDTLIKSQLL